MKKVPFCDLSESHDKGTWSRKLTKKCQDFVKIKMSVEFEANTVNRFDMIDTVDAHDLFADIADMLL